MSSQCNGCGACVLECPVEAIGWGKKIIGSIFTGQKGNCDLLSGELKTNEPVSEFIVKSLNEVVEERKKEYDYIIIDTAAGLHCDVITALESCDIVFAVTEPTPFGAHDLELILRLLKKLKIDSKIVLNRSDIGDKKIIKDLAKKYGKEISVQIPYSKKIINQNAKGEIIKDKNIFTINEYIK